LHLDVRKNIVEWTVAEIHRQYTSMNIELFEPDEMQPKRAIEQIIKRLRPAVKAFSWRAKDMKGCHLVKIQTDGQPIRLHFTEDALEESSAPMWHGRLAAISCR
jgi:hypothetical protein